MSNSLEDLKKLREITGAGVMDCRRALEENKGDLKKAEAIIRKQLQQKAAKKADRETFEGIVESYIHANGKVGCLVELLCETDFVARTTDFKNLAHEICLQVASMNPKDEKELLEQPNIRNPKVVISDMLKELSGKLGEKITIKQFIRFEVGK
ncbi:MAG: translation elongation factor Ts [Patescibacteria group bacterium]|nr:translation elongation factor Ts [Patescibacteria group bacterium]